MIAAARVLSGTRPAEVQFDELDDRIADGCAFAAADVIAGRFVPEPDLATDHENCRQIARLVKNAIKEYASEELTNHCREQLRMEKAHRRATEGEAKEHDFRIPF
jgi:hypothetical protein